MAEAQAGMTRQVFDILRKDSKGSDGSAVEVPDAEPANFLRHVAALSASKVADGLVDPKLVLSWLMTHLGAGTVLTGLLVPIRESGALLPQLFTAGAIRAMPRRKWAWVGGAVGQAVSAAGIMLVALTLEGQAAGLSIVALLAVLALSRSVCSASYKDILGKTVSKTRRGSATGAASSAASAAVVLFALILMTGWGERATVVLIAIGLAAASWAVGALILSGLREEASPADEGLTGWKALSQLSLLRSRPQLARFVAVRCLLVGTALAPPYLVMLGAGEGGALDALGALVLASALASLLSSWVWGRLSDRSSRWVLLLSGIAGAGALVAALVVHALGLASKASVLAVVLFALMIAYHGVRQGRSTHLVDMSSEEDRAAYTAVANTSVGVVLIAAGAAFAGLSALSVPLVIGVFAVMCLVAAAVARGLDEVQSD
ncbi:MFS transporter [Flavimaricola marinus]|uniref:Major Facilitator Superfamily protein n=1 Tax=Flavimaricola marinus TaxID=1819565 RepID=A0A238LKT1_9RHOB|nr:MFS transporter [Flavimaricola marinus]SMY09480.1 Major Facilitator Superfamily protein [Flavimaricola marinus]